MSIENFPALAQFALLTPQNLNVLPKDLAAYDRPCFHLDQTHIRLVLPTDNWDMPACELRQIDKCRWTPEVYDSNILAFGFTLRDPGPRRCVSIARLAHGEYKVIDLPVLELYWHDEASTGKGQLWLDAREYNGHPATKTLLATDVPLNEPVDVRISLDKDYRYTVMLNCATFMFGPVSCRGLLNRQTYKAGLFGFVVGARLMLGDSEDDGLIINELGFLGTHHGEKKGEIPELNKVKPLRVKRAVMPKTHK